MWNTVIKKQDLKNYWIVTKKGKKWSSNIERLWKICDIGIKTLTCPDFP